MAHQRFQGLRTHPEWWLWAIAAIGILLRIRANVEGRSLWLDETFLAVNFLSRDLWQLLTLQLENNQSAPPGFIAMTWAAFHLLGQNDFSVRFIPLVTGSLVPLVAVLVARSVLTGWLARVCFVTMAALSPVLIYYSAEFKQYSIDVLATMAVIYWWANWDRLRRSGWFYLAGALLAVSSLTAVLLLVLLCLVVLGQSLRRDRGAVRWQQTFFNEFSPALIATWSTAIFLHFLQAVTTTPAGFMLLWWGRQDAFAPLPTSLDGLLWYPLSFIKLFFLAFNSSAAASPGAELGLPFVWISGLVLVGLAVLLRSKWLLLPGLALAAAYTLAVLRMYPFSSRLALYLLPLLFLVIALALERSPRLAFRTQLRLVSLPLVAILGLMVGLAGYKWINPVDYRDTKWALSAVNSNAQPGQILAVDPDIVNQITWYESQGVSSLASPVVVQWIWGERRFADTSALEASAGVWTISALSEQDLAHKLRNLLDENGFTEVCYVFDEITSVALHVPVELAQSQQWECNFPKHN